MLNSVFIRRLRGHRNQVAAIRFLTVDESLSPSTSQGPAVDFLLTTAHDALLKLWDLTLQHCVQTLVGHPSDLYSMDLDSSRTLLLTGGGEGELKAWKIDHDALREGLKEDDSGEVSQISKYRSSWSWALLHR